MLVLRMTTPVLPEVPRSSSLRQGGPEDLSLALLEARNRMLSLLEQHEAADSGRQTHRAPAEQTQPPPLWTAGHVAWFAEWWIARNPQHALGTRGGARDGRLASLWPESDTWFHPQGLLWRQPLPDRAAIRAYMLEQLEATLALLDKVQELVPGLDLFRAVLMYEDTQTEHLLTRAQTLGLQVAPGLSTPPAQAQRSPLWLPGTRWSLGFPPGVFSLGHERQTAALDVPEYEIDAQPVCWAQFVEFVDDGGYDRSELWHPEGWKHAQASGRRAPRHVEQIGANGGSVLQSLFGTPRRVAGSQPVMHVTWWEADAWARWAGRRLPTEIEWEIAAQTASHRGFRWGEVQEWTAGTLRRAGDFVADAWTIGTPLDPQPLWGLARIRRGASFVTPPSLMHPCSRGFALPESDEDFVGFRTCSS